MLNTPVRIIISWLGALLLSFTAQANPLEQLVNDDQIQLKISQLNPQPVIARQRLSFEVRISSPIELDSDTRVEYRSIADTVTVESSTEMEVEALDSGFLHTLTFSLYPLKPGQYQLPALKVLLTLAQPDSEAVFQASVMTPPLAYQVGMPAELAQDANNYTVTTKLKVTDDIEIPEDGKLAVGDAIKRSLYLIAQDTPAVMLPEFDLITPEGVKLYTSPAEISDIYKPREKVNETHKEQQITYIFEQDGRYRLPAMQFVWWDIDSGERKVVELSEQLLIVGAGTPRSSVNDLDFTSLVHWFSRLNWIYLMVGVFTAAALWQLYNYRCQLLQLFHRINQTKRKRLRADYLDKVEQQQYRKAIACLYRVAQIDSHSDLNKALRSTPEQLAVLNQLMCLAYGEPSLPETINRAQARALFDSLLKPSKPAQSSDQFRFNFNLN